MRRSAALLLALLLTVPALTLALPLPGDEAPPALSVTIKRDAFGVPHVYADDAYALFWGNGYAQAQDRLFQMDVLRHVGKGESARIVGPGQLEMDLATRRELYTDEERTARWNALPADQRRMFQGFADGVNAWIEETRADPQKLSSEFYAIGHAPEDWVAEDTIAIAEFLLDVFGAGSGGNELDNAKALAHLQATTGAGAEAAFNDLWWMHTTDTYTTIDPAESVYPATEAPLAFEDVPAWQWEVAAAAAGARPFAGAMTLQEAAQAAGFPSKFGSNALVVSGSRMEGGAPALIGGPQMAYYNPMIPYEVALHGAGFDALGMGVGGAPGVIIGRTPGLAWTVTSGSSDQVDVVAVKLVPGQPRSYYDPAEGDGPLAMDCRIETHYGLPTAVDQRPPVLATQEVCRTTRGPVFAINEEAGYAFVRERTHRLDELRSGILWLTLSKAQTLEAFQAHMDSFRFEFNFHVASADGRIAYYHFGANPDRSEACDPRLPRLAGACDWTAVRTGDELPFVVDPQKGYIANWNNKPALGWSSGDAMEKWGPVHRAELLDAAFQKRLAGDGKLSTQDLKDINVEISTRSPFPPHNVPALLDATAASADPVVQAARAALAEWQAEGYSWMPDDATCVVAKAVHPCFGTHTPGFTIYERWRALAQDAAFKDELGPHVRTMGFVPETSSDPHAADHGREDNKENVLARAILGETAHDWLDDAPEGFLASTFEDAVDALRLEHGNDVSQWRQDAHTIKFVPLSGGPAWRIAMVNRPSFNHYYDFGTGEAGSVLPPGTDQAWAPLSFAKWQAMGAPEAVPGVHKRDQLDLYAAFGWKPAQMTPPGGWESEATFLVTP